MRLEYLIDGYNLLWSAMPIDWKHGPGNLERARNALLSWIHKRCEDPSRITVVFDAGPDAPKHVASDVRVEGIRVLFAKGHPDADELIGELCRKHTSPQRLVVVSDDRLVRLYAKRRRAQRLHCEQFIARFSARRTSKTDEPEKPERSSSADAAQWLAAFGEVDAGPSPPKDDFLSDMLHFDEDDGA
jgi:predicted RNA-binding protein with PIN domain